MFAAARPRFQIGAEAAEAKILLNKMFERKDLLPTTTVSLQTPPKQNGVLVEKLKIDNCHSARTQAALRVVIL